MAGFLEKLKRSRRALITIGILLLTAGIIYRLFFPGVIFLKRNLEAAAETGIAHATPESELRVLRLNDTEIPLKIMRPAGAPDKIAVVIHGVHQDGYHESRLIGFATQLVKMGYSVVLPDIASLKNYELVPTAVDQIEQTVQYALDKSGLSATDNKVALFGISFSGGLCLSAATRDTIRDRLSAVFAFGGHGDLDATLAYLMSGKLNDGSLLLPHVYGQAVVARIFAEQIVPPEQVALLRSTLFDYLKGSHRQLRKQLNEIPEPTRTIVKMCIDYKGIALGKLLTERIASSEMPAVLSPVRLQAPIAPVFVLHGALDNVIPRSQAVLLGDWASRKTSATVLVTPLIQHVELGNDSESTPVIEYYRMIRFWTELLRA